MALLLLVSVVVVSCTPKPTPAPAAAPTTAPVTKPTEAPAKPSGLPTHISIGTTSPGSSNYIPATAIAAIITRHTPMAMSVEPAGGSAGQTKLLKEKSIEFGMMHGFGVNAGFLGTHSYEEKGRQPFRMVATGYITPFGFAVAGDSGIKSIADFKGKKVNMGMQGDDFGTTYSKTMLAAYGLTEKDLAWATVTTSSISGNRDLIEGKLDASFGSVGGAKQLTIEKAINAYVVPISHEPAIKDKINELMPAIFPYMLKAGQPTVPVDTPIYAVNQVLYSTTDVSEEVVYQVVKSLYDNFAKEMARVHPSCAQWTLENALFNPVAPYHDGAVRYYKEKGVWTADLEKLQQEYLAKVK